MSDSQAELLRKRREARQKKILASGESRLSKITGTSGTNAQVAPTPSVLLAREELLKKEQEEERIKAAVASGTLLQPQGETEGGPKGIIGLFENRQVFGYPDMTMTFLRLTDLSTIFSLNI